MKSIDELTSRNNTPRLVPTFKQPERNLLSVFMTLLDLVPHVRGEFLRKCGYISGRTCVYQSYMEASYSDPKLPKVRPDGVLGCKRGNSVWSAFIEAKANQSAIRPEQIIDYLDLSARLDVNTIITISNEFARLPTELPYHISGAKRRKIDIYHFAWADIRTFLDMLLNDPALTDLEAKILSQCLDFFWEPTSGILTFDAMPPDWPKFVQAAGVALGFGTKTPGITDIIHGWRQERRDLCSKISHLTHLNVELGHEAGVRADGDDRLKSDRKSLADGYTLSAHYNFKQSRVKFKLLAELRLCKTSIALEISPPDNKKAKAVVNWFVSAASELEFSNALVSFDWKGRGQDILIPMVDLIDYPNQVYEGQKDAPRNIRILQHIHDVRRFKSRKKFIEDLETLTLTTIVQAQKAGWL